MSMKKEVVISISILVCLTIFITYIITRNMKDNSLTQNSSGYIGKIGEVISYIDHPIISINDVSIKYIGTREQPATE